jgi:hypothetical protein
MLKGASFLEWVQLHPSSYLWLVGGLIVIALALAVGPLLQGQYDETRSHDWWWGLPIFAILTAGRWPTFLFSRELGMDESQLLAGAHALAYDPVFWRSVTGGTAGPLDFFALWPAAWLCGWDTYLTARLTALVLLAISLILAHQCMALVLGRQVARIAGLGAVSLESLTHAADFLHYSTELLPLALLSVAAYAAVRRWSTPGGPLWSGLGGLMLGTVPFAKLQPAPLAAIMGLGWLWTELRVKELSSLRHRTYLIAGALLPAALFACQLTIASEWKSFFTSFLLFNLHYAASSSTTLGQSLRVMLGNAIWWDSLVPLGLLGSLVWLAMMTRLRAIPHRATRIFTRAAFVACLVALGSIVSPLRPYLHYWQLLLVPGVFLLGAVAARLLSTSAPGRGRRDQWLVALGAMGLVSMLLYHRSRNPNSFLADLVYFHRFTRTELAVRVAAQARPGETIAIWGRTDNIYVETGLRQATRDSHISGLIETGPQQEYFRQRYLADLLYIKPATFLDSVCPASLQYTKPEFAHDRNYPELAAVIRANYVLVEETGGARIYRRKDLVTR